MFNKNFFGRLFVNVGIFATMYVVLTYVTPIADLQFAIHGFGWVIGALSLIPFLIVSRFCAGVAKGLFGESTTSNPFMRIIGRVIEYCGFAALFVAGSVYLPAYFTVAPVAGAFWLFGGMAVAFAVSDIVEENLFPRS